MKVMSGGMFLLVTKVVHDRQNSASESRQLPFESANWTTG